ncbi:MAG: methylated-DNA--[protein]-cysteine S-methyltransferase [Saprospiraceae bacterium]|nr:methylated-DNA--[protein]-cysteine S-methyltransferase [Saprospiraceae bacterium]
MLQTTFCPTSFGCFQIKGSSLGISSVKLVENVPKEEKEIPEDLKACHQQLLEYFDGKRETFDLKLDWDGSADFNRAVWGELVKIPYGRTTSYSAIAEKIGNPTAVRAVGLANRNNPIAIIVPCHRVIAKNGDLQGYFYGLDMKRRLLELENPMSFARQGSLF